MGEGAARKCGWVGARRWGGEGGCGGDSDSSPQKAMGKMER